MLAYLYPAGLRSPLDLENVRLWGLELHLMADRLQMGRLC